MPVSLTCACGEAYTLKDEYAGAEVKCPRCGTVARAPAPAAQADPAFDRDKFLFRQKALAINEKYDIRDEQDRGILFIERPAMVLRNMLAAFCAAVVILVGLGLAFAAAVFLTTKGAEGPSGIGLAAGALVFLAGLAGGIVVGTVLSPYRHVTFWRDEARREELLRIRQVNKFQFPHARFSIETTEGKAVALLSKNYLFDILRKRWLVEDPSGRPLCVVKEDSVLLSLLRRILGPLFGLLRTNFVFLEGDGSREKVLGEFNRKFTLLDRYVLDMTPDPGRSIDRRIAVAMGVMLDTGERR